MAKKRGVIAGEQTALDSHAEFGDIRVFPRRHHHSDQIAFACFQRDRGMIRMIIVFGGDFQNFSTFLLRNAIRTTVVEDRRHRLSGDPDHRRNVFAPDHDLIPAGF